MDDRALLAASTFCFLLGFAYTMFAFGTGRYRPSRFHFFSMAGGFALQTAVSRRARPCPEGLPAHQSL